MQGKLFTHALYYLIKNPIDMKKKRLLPYRVEENHYKCYIELVINYLIIKYY